MYLSNDNLQKRINEISAQVETRSDGIIRYEEIIALPYFGAIILRFSVAGASVSLEELDRYEALLYEIVGDEFLIDFMGSVYQNAGVRYENFGRTLEKLADQYKNEAWAPTIHAAGIRSDAKELLQAVGLDPDLPVWEIQQEEEETLLLIMGEGEKQLARIDFDGKPLCVAEVPGKPCSGLFYAACHGKRSRVSLGRLLAEQS